MIGRHLLSGLALFIVVVATPAASGYQIIIMNDAAGEQEFQSAVQGFAYLGREELANYSFAGEASLGSPALFPGVSTTHFPGGSDAFLGITFQVNTLGGSPAALSPGGSLFAAGPGAGETGVVRIGPEDARHSMDLIFDPPEFRGMVRAVSFTVFQEGGEGGEVRLYNSENELRSYGFLPDSGPGEPGRIGIIAPEGEVLFRTNYWVPEGYGDATGMDLYAIPEPVTASSILGLIVLSLAVWRRRISNRVKESRT